MSLPRSIVGLPSRSCTVSHPIEESSTVACEDGCRLAIGIYGDPNAHRLDLVCRRGHDPKPIVNRRFRSTEMYPKRSRRRGMQNPQRSSRETSDTFLFVRRVPSKSLASCMRHTDHNPSMSRATSSTASHVDPDPLCAQYSEYSFSASWAYNSTNPHAPQITERTSATTFPFLKKADGVF